MRNFFPPDRDVPQDLFTKINLQIAQSPHTCFPTVIDSRDKAADTIIPLLIIRPLNLRKLRLSIFWQPYLLYTVSWIVEASHDEGRSTKESLPLGRLTEVSINVRGQHIDALHLVVLLSMILTVRNLIASSSIYEEPYSFLYKFHGSAIASICLDGCVEPSFAMRLTLSTRNLQSFEFTHLTEYSKRDIAFRRLSEILLRHGLGIVKIAQTECVENMPNSLWNLFEASKI